MSYEFENLSEDHTIHVTFTPEGGEGEGEPPYLAPAAIASDISSLGSIRSIRDSSLTGNRTGDALMSVYYTRQAGDTVETTLTSSFATSLVKNVVYRPAIFFLRASLKALILAALAGLSLVATHSLRRNQG